MIIMLHYHNDYAYNHWEYSKDYENSNDKIFNSWLGFICVIMKDMNIELFGHVFFY